MIRVKMLMTPSSIYHLLRRCADLCLCDPCLLGMPATLLSQVHRIGKAEAQMQEDPSAVISPLHTCYQLDDNARAAMALSNIDLYAGLTVGKAQAECRRGQAKHQGCIFSG